MGPVRAEVELDASRERAFGFVRDLANRPAFTDHFIDEFRLLRSETTGVGAGARFRLVPAGIWMDTSIVGEEHPHTILERGHGGRGNRTPVTTAWELVTGPGSLTTVRVRFWTAPAHSTDRVRELLGASSARCSRGWATALQRLRELLESEAPVVPRAVAAGGSRYPTDL